MFGRIVNGNFEVAPTAIVFENGGWISNPTDKQYIENGYKRLIETERPKISENECLKIVLTENESEINLSYEIQIIENGTI